MAETFAETWNKLPYVARNTTAIAAVLLVITILQPGLSFSFWRSPMAPFWQVWRYFTAPISSAGRPFNRIVNLYMWYITLADIEDHIFIDIGRTAYYFTWLAAGFNLIGPRIGSYFYMQGMANAFTWTRAQEDPSGTSVILGIIQIPNRYMPLANISSAISLAARFDAAYEPLLGIALAHSFMFFTEFLPQAGGTKFFADTPRFFQNIGKKKPADAWAGYKHVKARRLGSEKPATGWCRFLK